MNSSLIFLVVAIFQASLSQPLGSCGGATVATSGYTDLNGGTDEKYQVDGAAGSKQTENDPFGVFTEGGLELAGDKSEKEIKAESSAEAKGSVTGKEGAQSNAEASAVLDAGTATKPSAETDAGAQEGLELAEGGNEQELKVGSSAEAEGLATGNEGAQSNAEASAVLNTGTGSKSSAEAIAEGQPEFIPTASGKVFSQQEHKKETSSSSKQTYAAETQVGLEHVGSSFAEAGANTEAKSQGGITL